jgi:hypothetical protein
MVSLFKLYQIIDSTSNVLGRDWTEVLSELPGHSKYQWKDHYRLVLSLPHFSVELTFVFLCVTFRGSPFIHYTPVSSLLCVYNDSRDNSRKPTPSPSLYYSFTHTHRSFVLWLTPPQD